MMTRRMARVRRVERGSSSFRLDVPWQCRAGVCQPPFAHGFPDPRRCEPQTLQPPQRGTFQQLQPPRGRHRQNPRFWTLEYHTDQTIRGDCVFMAPSV